MCGICGIITRDREVARRAIETMVATMRHRGPDESGTELIQVSDRWLGLGACRLAILDTSPAGRQPMVGPQTGDALVHNGEIYALAQPGFRKELERGGVPFRGRSDTEALLRLLERSGDGALDFLDGMYAFAYFRRTDGALLLARDPAGIKPLYVAEADGHVLFASETRALLETGLVPRDPDEKGLAGFLSYGAVQEPQTMHARIRSLDAGSAAEIDVGRPDAFRPTWLWSPPSPRPRSADETAREIREALEREVRRHLVSDRPLGIFLSSGLDSSIIASLATSAVSAIRTITIGVAPDDEDPIARRTAESLGARHHTVRLSEPEVIEGCLDWLRCMDQPTIDGLNTYLVSKAARREGIVAALSGTGGDELFGGYPSFREVPALYRRVARLRMLPRALRRAAAHVAAAGRSRVVRDKAADLAASDGTLASVYFHRRRLLSDRAIRALGLTAVEPQHLPVVPGDPVASVARLEFSTYLRSMLLRDSDVASMANSLELRVPFLTRPVLDLMLSVPGPELLPDGEPPKHLARLAFRNALRPELLKRPKRGFTLPMSAWMRGPLRDLCEESMNALRKSGRVRPEGVDAVWREFASEPDSPAWSRAWALVVLGSFLL